MSGHVLDSPSIIAHHVVEIVGILVVTASLECESLQDHECTRSANPDIPGRALAEDRSAAETNILTIQKGKTQTGDDKSSEVRLKVTQTSSTGHPAGWAESGSR